MDTNRGRNDLDTERGVENVNSAGDTGGGGDGNSNAAGDRVVTRAEAKAAGLKRYFTGVACANGHVAERYVNDGKCSGCDDAKKLKKRRARGAPVRMQASGVQKTAAKAGLARYFTGIPCPRGHVAERMTSCGHCVECLKIKTPEQRKKRNQTKDRNRSLRRDAYVAAATLTEITGIPHVVVETIDANGKKTFQPAPAVPGK